MNDTPHIDFKALSATLLPQAETVIRELLPNGKLEGREWVALNPTRADNTPGSFKSNIDSGEWGDFASGDKGGDLISLTAYVMKAGQAEAARYLMGKYTPNLAAPTTSSTPRKEEAWKAITPVPDDAASPPQSHPKHGKPANAWEYTDAAGRPLCYVYRFDKAGRKSFAPLTYCQNPAGVRRWQWQALPEPRPLYNLGLLMAHPNAAVVVCEGEKAADAAAELFPGHVTTTSLNGSKSADKTDWTPLAGKHCIIWPDADGPGRTYAEEVTRQLRKVGAAAVQWIRPDAFNTKPPAGWDAADALETGWTPERVAALLEAGKLLRPPMGNGHDSGPPEYELPPLESYAADTGDEPPTSRERTAGKPGESVREALDIKSLAAIGSTDYPPERYAVPGILPEGLTILAGPPKVKKSWLALGLGIAVNSGGFALGKVKVEQGGVLYLALEDRERRLKKRAKAIQDDLSGLTSLDIATGWKRLDNGGLDDLRAYCREHQATRLIIIDTLAMVRPKLLRGEPSYDADYRAIALLKSIADEFSVCILVVTHTRKQEAEDFLDSVTGTHGVSGAADGVLILKRARCSNLATLSITGRDIEEEREVVLQWHQPTCTWHLTDDTAAEVRMTPERRRIIEILQTAPTPLSSKQIATAYHGREMTDRKDKAWAATRVIIGKMVRSGELTPYPDKTYSVTHTEKEIPLCQDSCRLTVSL